jgi:hypothetical protein
MNNSLLRVVKGFANRIDPDPIQRVDDDVLVEGLADELSQAIAVAEAEEQEREQGYRQELELKKEPIGAGILEFRMRAYDTNLGKMRHSKMILEAQLAKVQQQLTEVNLSIRAEDAARSIIAPHFEILRKAQEERDANDETKL